MLRYSNKQVLNTSSLFSSSHRTLQANSWSLLVVKSHTFKSSGLLISRVFKSSSRLTSGNFKFTQAHCPQPNQQTHDNRILQEETKDSLLLQAAAAAVCVSDSPGSSLASFPPPRSACATMRKSTFAFAAKSSITFVPGLSPGFVYMPFDDSNYRNCLM